MVSKGIILLVMGIIVAIIIHLTIGLWFYDKELKIKLKFEITFYK